MAERSSTSQDKQELKQEFAFAGNEVSSCKVDILCCVNDCVEAVLTALYAVRTARLPR
jgi:hypothetical protein